MTINRIYETQNLLSLLLVSFLVGLRTLSAPLYLRNWEDTSRKVCPGVCVCVCRVKKYTADSKTDEQQVRCLTKNMKRENLLFLSDSCFTRKT